MPGVGTSTYGSTLRFKRRVQTHNTTTKTTLTNYTLSGFCLQYLITDLVFSQPPRIISYIGSTSAGACVRDTWQLWGPRYSNFRDPDTTGPNLYSKLSGVLNSAPSVPIIKGIISFVGYILCDDRWTD